MKKIPWGENKMAGKTNRITAKGVKGIYKGKLIEVHIGKSSDDTQLFVDGKKLELVQSIHISARLGKLTVMTIEMLKGD